MALQRANLDRLVFLRGANAGSLTQFFGGTNASATAAKNVRFQNGLRGSEEIAGGDLANERRHVDAGRAGLNAWRIVAEVTAAGLDHRLRGRQRRMRIGKIGGELRCVQPAGGNIANLVQRWPSRCLARSVNGNTHDLSTAFLDREDRFGY